MPDYGVLPNQTDGMLTWDWVERRMTDARNYWISTVRPNGRPHATPIWAVWVEGRLYFGTDRQSVKAKNLRRNNHVAIHLESGDDTVIFEGALVEADVSRETQDAIDAEYTRKYGFHPQLEEEGTVLYCLVPRKVMAWQEKDFPATATYWLFDVSPLN